MSKDLLSLIEDRMPEFSKGQKLIGKFIVNHYDKAAFMTASKLGTTVGVSESTVVRFASEVGYEGYPQLQKALQELIRNRLTSVQRMEVTNEQLGESDVLSKILSSDIEKIRKTMEEISKEEFEAAVKEFAKTGQDSDAVSGLIAYTSHNENEIYTIDYSNRFTAQVLYRLDYKWPVTDDRYLENAIAALDRLTFFD